MTGVSSVRQLATSDGGSLVAAAEATQRVHIFDLESYSRVAAFETILDFGGRRLALAADGRYCAAGAYIAQGVAVYDAISGRLVWQRKNLKKVQRVQFRKDGSALLASVEGGPTYILDAQTGVTRGTLPKVTDLQQSPFSSTQLACSSGWYVLRSESGESKIDLRAPGNFCQAAFTPRSVVLEALEPTGVVVAGARPSPQEQLHVIVSCSLADGQSRWRHLLPPGTNIQRLGFAEEAGEVIAVVWSFVSGDDKRLIRLDMDSGSVRHEQPLRGPPYATEFANRGRLLVTSDGDVINIADGIVAGRLSFPRASHPEDYVIP